MKLITITSESDTNIQELIKENCKSKYASYLKKSEFYNLETNLTFYDIYQFAIIKNFLTYKPDYIVVSKNGNFQEHKKYAIDFFKEYYPLKVIYIDFNNLIDFKHLNHLINIEINKIINYQPPIISEPFNKGIILTQLAEKNIKNNQIQIKIQNQVYKAQIKNRGLAEAFNLDIIEVTLESMAVIFPKEIVEFQIESFTVAPGLIIKNLTEPVSFYPIFAECVLSKNGNECSGMSYANGCRGRIEICQTGDDDVFMKGEIIGLKPGYHGMHIHESANFTNGCQSTGGHYNPYNQPHGGNEPTLVGRHVGDLGNIYANELGIANIDLQLNNRGLKLYGDPGFSILDRAIVIHEGKDDLGKGGEIDGRIVNKEKHTTSLIAGNSGSRIACGKIVLLTYGSSC